MRLRIATVHECAYCVTVPVSVLMRSPTERTILDDTIDPSQLDTREELDTSDASPYPTDLEYPYDM